MKKPEILAPAGSLEALEAAVRCGADAVYLGQKNFSARANSRNFDAKELREAADYAHRFGVKIHQALNTVVFDRELEALKGCIRTACEAGVDALIVQDWGVAAAVKAFAPSMPLHASTQMAVHSPMGVKTAARLGFSRVVLARELSREEIKAIRESTELEIETFVHGAHCMSMSGQCYMSAMFGGKSGNRGQCAQPCRLPFWAGCPSAPKVGENVLSLKDMSLVERLPELAAMGIDSFKIEGRMKRPEYVAAAVTACKKALSGEEPDLDTLQAVFSRSGFTSAYFDGEMGREMFGFRRKEDVTAAASVFKELAGLYHKDVPRAPVSMGLSMKAGEPAALTVTDGEHTVSVSGEIPREAASAPADLEQARKFLGKLGNTPFYLDSLTGEIGEGLTMPASAFNALRRDAAAKLEEARKEPPVPFADGEWPLLPEGRNSTLSPEKWGKFQSVSQVSSEALGEFSKILLPVPELEAHWEGFSAAKDRLGAVLPRFLFDSEKEFLSRLAALKEKGLRYLYCDNAAHIALARKSGLEALGGAFLNLNNSYAVSQAEKLGLAAAVLSFEGKLEDMRKIRAEIPLGAVVYGYLPLMAVRSCPVKAQIGCAKCGRKGFVTDRKGISFPVRCDYDQSTSLIYNVVPLEMSDRKAEMGFLNFWLFSFAGETAEEVLAVIRRYNSGAKPAGEYTRGLYYRGID